jgi:hypothetical protein
MRVWAAHALFATILVGSLAARERAAMTPIPSAAFESAVLRVATSKGLEFREYRANTTGTELRTLVLDAVGCSQPMFVLFRLATFEDEATIKSTTEHSYLSQYIYIDRRFDKPSLRPVLIQRIKYGLLSMFGSTDYAPYSNIPFVLQVETPVNCRVAEKINWSPAWSRSFIVSH